MRLAWLRSTQQWPVRECTPRDRASAKSQKENDESTRESRKRDGTENEETEDVEQEHNVHGMMGSKRNLRVFGEHARSHVNMAKSLREIRSMLERSAIALWGGCAFKVTDTLPPQSMAQVIGGSGPPPATVGVSVAGVRTPSPTTCHQVMWGVHVLITSLLSKCTPSVKKACKT